MYTAYDDKVQRSCHLPAPASNCMSHHKMLQDFSSASEVTLDKNKKITLSVYRPNGAGVSQSV
jgi:hypothetical protein